MRFFSVINRPRHGLGGELLHTPSTFEPPYTEYLYMFFCCETITYIQLTPESDLPLWRVGLGDKARLCACDGPGAKLACVLHCLSPRFLYRYIHEESRFSLLAPGLAAHSSRLRDILYVAMVHVQMQVPCVIYHARVDEKKRELLFVP